MKATKTSFYFYSKHVYLQVAQFAVMKELKDKIEGVIEGDLLIEHFATITGAITGNLTVREPARLVIRGTVAKDVFVGYGSIVQVFGNIGGNVYLEGGMLELWGTINGSIIRKAGPAMIYSEATINGKITGSA